MMCAELNQRNPLLAREFRANPKLAVGHVDFNEKARRGVIGGDLVKTCCSPEVQGSSLVLGTALL